ncbi:MAG: ChbG/HpnK family deacetylase [Betaproteobacteria bacterium]
MLKTILICADDFGLTPGINSGIIELAAQGRINATSCMTRGRFFSRDAPTLAPLAIQTGLHLNLTESLEGGEFYQPLPQLLRNSYLRKLDPRIITAEIEYQLDAFETILGRTPDYIDGHQHVHQFPVIRDCLIAVLQRRYPEQRPWLRSTLPGALSALPLKEQFKAWFIGFLGARSLTAHAQNTGFSMNHHLLGVYDFTGGEHAYLEFLDAWLAAATANDLLMCHPATVADPADVLGQQRVAEFAVLSGERMPALLERHSISLSKQVR